MVADGSWIFRVVPTCFLSRMEIPTSVMEARDLFYVHPACFSHLSLNIHKVMHLRPFQPFRAFRYSVSLIHLPPRNWNSEYLQTWKSSELRHECHWTHLYGLSICMIKFQPNFTTFIVLYHLQVNHMHRFSVPEDINIYTSTLSRHNKLSQASNPDFLAG